MNVTPGDPDRRTALEVQLEQCSNVVMAMHAHAESLWTTPEERQQHVLAMALVMIARQLNIANLKEAT
jgi:hypothetical protein